MNSIISLRAKIVPLLILTASLSACSTAYMPGSEEDLERKRVEKIESEREAQISRMFLRENRNLGKIDENGYHGPRLKATEIDGITVHRERLTKAHK